MKVSMIFSRGCDENMGVQYLSSSFNGSTCVYMEVSWNGGTPSSHPFLDGFSLANHPFLGTAIDGNCHIYIYYNICIYIYYIILYYIILYYIISYYIILYYIILYIYIYIHTYSMDFRRQKNERCWFGWWFVDCGSGRYDTTWFNFDCELTHNKSTSNQPVKCNRIGRIGYLVHVPNEASIIHSVKDVLYWSQLILTDDLRGLNVPQVNVHRWFEYFARKKMICSLGWLPKKAYLTDTCCPRQVVFLTSFWSFLVGHLLSTAPRLGLHQQPQKRSCLCGQLIP